MKLSVRVLVWSIVCCFSSLVNAQPIESGISPAGVISSNAPGGEVGSFSSSGMGLMKNSNRNDLVKTQQASSGHSIVGTDTQDGMNNAYVEKSQRTGFQDFVYAATGKNYDFFGYELFTGAKYGSVSNLPVSMGYIIGPGDEIDIKFQGNVDFATRLTVDRNGQITIPKIGSLMISGVTYENLEKTISDAVSRIYRGVDVNATLGKMKSIRIYMVGDAKRPGAHIVPGYSTLIGAIFDAGGPSVLGTMRDINLVRGGNVVAKIDLYDFIMSGKTADDVYLKNGDVIQIPKAKSRVAVTGAFDKSGIYELKEATESVAALLSYGGGLGSLSTPYKMHLERVDPLNKGAARSVIELDLTKDAEQVKLQDGDILTIFPVTNEFRDAVTLRGNVASPLRYSYKPGMKISDLIPEPKALVMGDYYQSKNMLVQFSDGKKVKQDQVVAEVKNLLDEINWDYAVVQRFDYANVKTNLIRFNLKKAVVDRDVSNNIELKPGDVVTVFGVKDMPIPASKVTHFVKISGEVNVPGVYQVEAGKTLNDLLNMAGGVTREAYIYGALFSRESTRAQQQENLDKAIRQMESEINLQTNNILQNSTDATGVAMQAQIAGQKLFLQRLQSLKATGRVSLGLSPADNALPMLKLENGDAIVIPAKSSFVSAFGAVFAETSFIYKDGLTVSDLLDRAGVTRSADVDSVFLVRADGSIEVNDAARSMWSLGSGFLNKKIYAGDTVFVPEMLDRRQAYSKFMQGAKDWTQLIYQFGLGAAAFKVLRN